MIKNKAKNMFVSFSMALLFACGCILPQLGAKRASADSEAAASAAGYDTLYYISDYAESSDYCDDFVSAGVISDYELLYIPSQDFWDIIKNTSFDYISDAYVIFETRNGFPRQMDINSDNLYPNILYNIFRGMKQNGCKIMFVCGTDETRFYGYNRFLEYVDVQVSVDMLYVLTTSMLYKHYDANNENNQLSDISFLVDAALSQGVENDLNHNPFFKYYFDVYFKDVYRDEIEPKGLGRTELFINHGLQTLCHIPDDTQADLYYCLEDVGYNDLTSFLSATYNPLSAIGATYLGETYTYDWAENVARARDDSGKEFLPVYLCNREGYDFDGYLSDVHMLNVKDLRKVMTDFLGEEDLSDYNNVPNSRCDITYCPYYPKNGEEGGDGDGWLVNLHNQDEDGFPINGWRVIMNAEDYAYYYGDW